MNRSLTVQIIVALACGGESALRPGLRVKVDINPDSDADFFFDIPRTVQSAIFNNWTITPGVSNLPNANFTLYCASDRVVCGFYDNSDRIAGLQIALDQSEFSDAVYDWDLQGFSLWCPPASGEQDLKTFRTTQIFFVSENGATENLELTNEFESVLREDALWVTGFNKKLVNISRNESDLKNTIFTRQMCHRWMGLHYNYNMSSTMPCSPGHFFPWFILVDSGELIGVGLLVIGNMKLVTGKRDWFERPDELVVKKIIPDGPECIYELVKNVGVISMHIYFTDQPCLIDCPK